MAKKEKEMAIVPHSEAEALISQAIVNKVDVGTMERLLAMRDKIKAEQAREAYNRAMAKFQAESPAIEKTKAVHTRDGRLAYKYAPIESIVAQVKDSLQRNGFSYSTNMELQGTNVKVVVKVVHELGHSELTEMTVPLGTKTQVMSDTQVVAAAQTFAKRYAFCNAFGILTGDEDTDAAPKETYDTSPVPAKAKVTVHGADPVEKPTDLKREIMTLLKAHPFTVGEDLDTKAGCEAAVEKITGLKLAPEFYAEIITRLKS